MHEIILFYLSIFITYMIAPNQNSPDMCKRKHFLSKNYAKQIFKITILFKCVHFRLIKEIKHAKIRNVIRSSIYCIIVENVSSTMCLTR